MSNGELLSHGIMLCFLCVGFYTLLLGYDENQCKMTYMYNPPEYAKVPLEDEVTEAFPRYNLYLYGEGHYFQQVKSLDLSGVPVLFIPGQGGSYKQARSIGSVLLWKHINKPGINHFNVFTLDLNEELVAFYGGTLQAQTEFLRHCIEKILSLYKTTENKPKSVAIVGHSMGGILSKGVFTLNGFDPTKVSTIVMLATPNLSPVLSVDSLIAGYYERVNSFWRKNAQQLQDVNIVSVGGGPRDYQVPTALTRLPLNSSSNTFSTIATTVPRVHVSTEHQTVVWCNQLVLVTARFFIDLLSQDTKQITTDVAQRTRVMDFHFRRNPGFDVVPKSDKPKLVRLSKSHAWNEVHNDRWSMNKLEAGPGTYFSFSIDRFLEQISSHFVARTDSPKEKWILACSVDETGACQQATDLSAEGTLTDKYKIIHLDLVEMKERGFTHVLFPMTKNSKANILDVNVLSDGELSASVTVPHVFSNLWTYNKGASHTLESGGSVEDRFYYRVTLEGFQNIYQSFNISMADSGANQLLKMEVPWDEGQTIYGSGSILAGLYSGPTDLKQSAVLHVYADAGDHKPPRFNLKVDFFQVLGSLVRFFGVSLPVYVVCNILLTYFYMVNQMQLAKPCHSIWDAHNLTAKPYKIQPFISLFKYFYTTFALFSSGWTVAGLPLPDSITMENENQTWFTFAPLVLFLFAFELFSVTRIIQRLIMVIITPLLLRLSTLAPFALLTDSATARFVLHSVVLAAAAQQFSSLAFLYIAAVSFCNVCLLRKTALDNPAPPPPPLDVQKPAEGGEDESASKEESSEAAPNLSPAKKEPDPTSPEDDTFSVNYLVLQMWIWLALFSLPSLVVLLVNFRNEGALPSDPMLPQAAIASVIFVAQSVYPTHDGIVRSKVAFLSWLKMPLLVLMALISSHSFHRAPWFILAFLGFHSLCQIV